MNAEKRTLLTGFVILIIAIAMMFFKQTRLIATFLIGFGLAEIGNAHRYRGKNDNNSSKKKH